MADRTTSRGILNPRELTQHVRFARFEAPDELAGLVEWVWSVDFDLPAGATFRSHVLSLPAVNISVGNAAPEGEHPPPGPYPVTARVVGLARRAPVRMLSGRGWNVAAKTTAGGFGGFVTVPVSRFTDHTAPMDEVLPVDVSSLTTAMDEAATAEARKDVLVAALVPVVAAIPPDRRAAAREVSRLAAVAERDTRMRSASELARLSGMTLRTLQRLFAEHVGASPSWVIRRFRITDAADRVARGEDVRWADVAADLGYADQAHLTRDFVAATGYTPAAYAARQRTT